MSELSLTPTPPNHLRARVLRRRPLVRRRPDVLELEAATESAAPSAQIQLPFDPLRLIDVLVRRWWLMLLVGGICAAGMFFVGQQRFETLHSARAQIIKLESASVIRQSESGEVFRPQEMTVPTFLKLMHHGSVVEAATKRLEGRYAERTLRAGLIIQPEKGTEIVSISMTSDQSPESALEMLQAYTTEVLQLGQAMQRSAATDTKRFLQQQIERTESDLLATNRELLEYAKQEQLIDADKQMDAWLSELGNFTMKYESLRLDHETLELRIQGVEKELGKVDTNATRLDTARRELAELGVRYTDEHPVMIEAREKLLALEASLKNGTTHVDAPPRPGESALAESLYLDLVRLRSEKQVMQEQLGKLEKIRTEVNERLAQLPRKAMEYARIKSRQQALETARGLLASRHREAVLYEQDAQGWFKLFAMDRPQDIASVPPTQKLVMVTGGGFASGAGLVAVALIGLTLLDSRIRSAGDLRRATGVPVIATMPADVRLLNESEEAWAFRAWTRLQPMLLIPARGEATICGLLHDRDAATATRMAQLLARAAVRRGLACVTLSTEGALDIESAMREPTLVLEHLRASPCTVCTLRVGPEWVWSAPQRQQWQAAMALWRSSPEVVVLMTLPSVEEPEALLLAEKLPNLLWAGRSGGTQVRRVGETLRMYRDSGCRLIASVLDHAPQLKPQALARFAGLLLLLAGGLSHAEQASAPLRLGPGDSVNITLLGMEGHERTQVPIGPDGTLTYLHARDIPAAGLTMDELRAQLTTELRRYYRSAKVVVTPHLFQSQKVYVLGKVVKKGVITLDRPMTLLEVIAAAGGLETGLFQQNTVELADLGRSFVMRGRQRLPVNLESLFMRGDMSQNVRVESGDYLYFPSANSNEIYVLGGVRMQGMQGLLAHTSVHSAIAQAGGFTPKAYSSRVLVIRGSLDKPERHVVDMEALLSARVQGFRLEPKDIVFVADKPWARAEELMEIALNAFLQGAVSGWTSANVGPFIQQAVLPQIR